MSFNIKKEYHFRNKFVFVEGVMEPNGLFPQKESYQDNSQIDCSGKKKACMGRLLRGEKALTRKKFSHETLWSLMGSFHRKSALAQF